MSYPLQDTYFKEKMKIRNALFIAVLIAISACQQAPKPAASFSFAFLTDIHIQHERNADKGLLMAIDTINQLHPDFVLTGGDNIMDALGQSYERSMEQYQLYQSTMENLDVPYYNTMGNHELFGVYEKSGVDTTHEEYGKKMYEDLLAQRYYSFNHKNWHFIVLDGIGMTNDRHYYGFVDSTQIDWLKKDLETNKDLNTIVSIHIPLLSVGEQVMNSPTAAFNEASVVTNANEVRQLLEQYKVKAVLQGHLHFLEDICYNGIHYITGGAVSSNWWKGTRFGMEEGFLLLKITGNKIDWNYIDYGWDAEKGNELKTDTLSNKKPKLKTSAVHS